MKKEFSLHTKPFSINATYAGSRKFITKACLEWRYDFINQINQQEYILDALESLRYHFDPLKHYYSVSLTQYYPREILFNKKGEFGSRSMDLSNTEKGIIDLLFLPQFYELPNPEGFRNLNLDDKHIGEIHSAKRASDNGTYRLDVSIEIKDLT